MDLSDIQDENPVNEPSKILRSSYAEHGLLQAPAEANESVKNDSHYKFLMMKEKLLKNKIKRIEE